jgi:hypothetical protein
MKTPAALCIALFTLAAHAGAPDKLAQTAGAQPSERQARNAVIQSLAGTTRDPTDFSRVRFLSGPHLVTGINFAGSREQAWQMCVITGDGNLARGPLALEITPFPLRTNDSGVTVMQIANWKDSDVSC